MKLVLIVVALAGVWIVAHIVKGARATRAAEARVRRMSYKRVEETHYIATGYLAAARRGIIRASIRDVHEYEAHYKVTHPAPQLLASAVFGLPELRRDEIAGAKLVGASGCHSAGVILALAPLYASGVIEPNAIADTKTGLSGAGRALNQNVHFSEADENVAPYGLDGHRHVPEMVQELAALAEQPASAVAWNGVGLVLMELRRYEDARNAFGRAVDADPGFAAAHYNLSFVLSQLGDFDGALRETRRALELEPLYVPQKFSLTIDLQFEDPTIAIAPELAAEAGGNELAGEFEFDAPALDRIFEELTPGPQQAPVAAAPGDALDLARDYIGKGLLDLALAEISRATARGASRAGAAVLLGDVFAKRGLYGEALERYREARAADPNNSDATLGEIRALLALGWASDAAPLADELARRVRGDVEVLVARARVRLAVNDALGALDCIREAQSVAPGRADLLHLQAQVSSRLGDRSAALAAFNAALQLDPSLVRVWYELGALEEERENWAAARSAYERALDLLPTYSAAALALADLLGRRDSPRAAIGVLIRLLETDPWELEALTALGRALLDDGRTAQAIEAFARVLRFDPDHAGALYHQGAALARQRRFDEAVEAWERVVQLDPAGPYAAQARSRARSARDLQHIFAASAG